MAHDYAAWLAFIGERRSMPFAWGANDCVLFVAEAVRALNGRDLLAEAKVKPTWTTEAGAARVLARLGGLEAVVDGLCRPIPLAHAQRGDIALVEVPGGQTALMVVEGKTLVGPALTGLKRLPRRALKAWSAAR